MVTDCKPVQATHPPLPHPPPTHPTPSETKPKEISWLMVSGTMDEELSLMSASMTRTPAPMETLPHAKSLCATPKRRKTSTRPPASNTIRTSPLLSTPSMVWPQRMHEQPSNALHGCLQRSGVTHTRTWQASFIQGGASPLSAPTPSSYVVTEPTHSANAPPPMVFQPPAMTNYTTNKNPPQ
ncbi:hypothetical protein ACHAW6_004527 [Cyclotella cf. meneghiniana]